MQQVWDDIRRTVIVGLDIAHETLEKSLGKEVTPETINNYLESSTTPCPVQQSFRNTWSRLTRP